MVTIVNGFRLFISVILLSLLDAASIGISSPTDELHVTGERVQRDVSVMGPPERIYRAKISMVGTKMVMGDSRSTTRMFDIYQFRVSWAEPDSWNDNFDDSGRHYELYCWVEDGVGNRKTIFKRQVPAFFSGYHEKYRFPPDLDLATQCQVRAINSAGFTAPWTRTNRVRVQNIPVYFPGFHGVDLRGLSEEQILAVLSAATVLPSETKIEGVSVVDQHRS